MKPLFFRRAHAHRRPVGAFVAAALLAGSSTLAQAQTVKREDLIGAWAVQGETTAHVTIRPDSTITVMVGSNMGPKPASGHWELHGDTLIVGELTARAGTQSKTFQPGPRLVKLQGSQLTLVKINDQEQGPPSRTYERLASAPADSTKPAGTP